MYLPLVKAREPGFAICDLKWLLPCYRFLSDARYVLGPLNGDLEVVVVHICALVDFDKGGFSSG